MDFVTLMGGAALVSSRFVQFGQHFACIHATDVRNLGRKFG